jgi:SAM-dependent methyltransferase
VGRLTIWWLDLGSGIDAENWAATPAPPRVRRIAMDPLITSGMVESGRLAPLPPDILRVGAEIRPEGSVEAGKQRSFLPFQDGLFTLVHCGFVLHLYLETLELLAQETHRVLAPGGTLEVLLPHFGDSRSEGILARTEAVLREVYGWVTVERFQGPYTTFWAELYRDRTYRLTSHR